MTQVFTKCLQIFESVDIYIATNDAAYSPQHLNAFEPPSQSYDKIDYSLHFDDSLYTSRFSLKVIRDTRFLKY